MFTIKQAAQRTGVPEASLRAWERRYGVVTPQRTESGYRMYDERALATLSSMRELVDQGWSPAAAAARLTEQPPAPAGQPEHAEAAALTSAFLDAAATVDPVALEGTLDRAFALGAFETVADTWLMPALRALGAAWAEGWVDVAGEHAASHAVMRRLSQSFAAASSVTRGPRVVVALPPGSLHELGALAFATAARRRGHAVVYLGADLPVGSWVRAVQAFPTRAAVIAVPDPGDRAAAARTARALLEARGDILVASGGPHGEDLAPGVVSLPQSIAAAVEALDVRGR
jgi:DNA-binding transcriptional MerR regulator/methylmalonyl-CoA mutase cobalamin-binding subunit